MRTKRLLSLLLALCLLLALPAAAFAADPAAATPVILYMKTDNFSKLIVSISSATPGAIITYNYNGSTLTGASPLELHVTMPTGGIYVTAAASALGYADSSEASLYISPSIFEGGTDGVNATLPVLYPDKAAADFTDVAAGDWYVKELDTLVKAGVISGMTATTFAPKSQLKMSEYVKMLVSALYGDDLSQWEYYQIDNKYATWYAKYVGAAKSGGLADGVDMSYEKLQNAITRYDMARLLVNAARILGENLTIAAGTERKIADYYEIPSDFRDSVAKAYSAGLLQGYDEYGNFSGNETLTRAQACVTIVRLFDKTVRV